MLPQERLRQLVTTLSACRAEVERFGGEIPDRSVNIILGLLWLASDEIELVLQGPSSSAPSR